MMEDASGAENAWMWVGKLAPPQMQLEAVDRQALLTRLQDHSHISLALVISPPGFGKTTLLTQWRARLQAQATATPVAWLSLDEADKDANRFLAYMLLALEAAGVDLGGLSQRAHAQALDPSPQRTIAALLQALARGGARITLMLDDYHRAASAEVDEIVLTLLERASPWLQLVVASRSRPHWPLSTLKARGLLHEIDASDLVLSLSESSHILGADIERAELSIVHSRTEGWAVAVQLARLWFQRGAGSSHGLQAFSGRVSEVAEYLAEQIIENLPPDCRDFLVETSLLERFNAELADVARGRNDSAAILARLAHFEALLVPLDVSRSWFRYHLMLADFLRPRLEARRAQEIHRAAARWLALQNDWVIAVTHALRANDTALAIELVHRAGGWELVLRNGIQYTQSLLQQFDDLVKRTDPELLMMQAYLHAKLGDESLSMELLRLAEVAVQGMPKMQRDYHVIEALVHVYFDRLVDNQRWPTSAQEANRQLPDDPLGQATLLCVGAVMGLSLGRMEQAMQAAQAARTRMRVVGSPLGENYCLLHISQAQTITGQLPASRQRIDEALALADANFGTDSSLKALVGCYKAQHLYWQGHWVEAMAWLRAGQDTVAHIDGWFDVFAMTAEMAWRMALRQEGPQRALARLDDTELIARQRQLPRLGGLVRAWRVDLLAQCGQVAQAQKEAQSAQLEAALPQPASQAAYLGFDWRLLEAGALALGRVQVATGAAQPAVALLERAARMCRQAGLLLPAWRLQLAALVAKRRVSEVALTPQETLDALAPLLQHDLAGLLLDAGPAILPVLQGVEGSLPPVVQTVVTQLRGWKSHPPRARTQFSAKESEVLELLIAGQPNKTIARSLGVSENTVKFHLKQIFQKLGVDNRSAAIASALRQGFATPFSPSPNLAQGPLAG
jgi:LuxR family maltose regulon positive regulatory protein